MRAGLLKLAFAGAWACAAVGIYDLATMMVPYRIAETLRWPSRAVAGLVESLGASSNSGQPEAWGAALANLLIATVGAAVGLAISRGLSRNVSRLRFYAVITACAAPWLANAQAIFIGVATRRSVAEGVFVALGTAACVALTAVAFRFSPAGKVGTALILGGTAGLFSGAFLYWLNSPASLILQLLSILLMVSFFPLAPDRAQRMST